jgi:hypothetical protein
MAVVSIALCGDDVVNGTEDCDGIAMGMGTCESEGFTGGTLSCAQSCVYDTSACTSH